MSIKAGDKDLFPYLGDYGPVNIYKGEHKMAGWEWAKQSSQEVSFENTYKDFVDVGVDGRSYQHAGSGKNLITKDIFDPETYSHGTYNQSRMIQLKPNTEYTMSSKGKGHTPSLSLQAVLDILDGSNGIIDYSYRGATRLATFFNTRESLRGEIIRTFRTSDSGKIYFSFYDRGLYKNHGDKTKTDWIDDMVYELQLEEGSTATEYELPAPTPDHPIEIHSLNDFDVVSQKSKGGLIDGVEVGGRNLLREQKITSYPRTYHVDTSRELVEDGDTPNGWFIRFNDWTATGNSASIYFSPGDSDEYTENLIGKEITISLYARSDIPTVIAGENINTEWRRITRKYSSFPSFNLHWYIRNEEGQRPTIDITSIKIEKGTIATDWTPAPEDIKEDDNHPLIDKINISLSEPLRSVGDVKDRLFRDSDGLWKIERKIGSETLDGTTLLSKGSDGYDKELTTDRWITPDVDMSMNTEHSRTSHFKRYSGYGLWFSEWIGHIVNTINQFHINFPNDLIGVNSSDNSSIRTQKINDWLQYEHDNGTPVIIQYELRVPAIETLDQELQDKLNNLRSFLDSNYIYTVKNEEDDLPSHISKNLKPTIHAQLKVKDI